MTHAQRWTAVLLAGVLATGCSHATRMAQSQDITFCARTSATVYVQNDNWLDIVLYAVRGGTRVRLGQVSSVNSAKFELPTTALGSGTGGLYILADPVGVTNARTDLWGHNNMWATDDIAIAPGHTVIEIRLDNIIDHSSYGVFVEDPEDI